MSNAPASDANKPTPPSSSSTPQPPYHSLPARPPPSVAGPFKPAAGSNPSAANAASGHATSYSQPPTYNAPSSAFTAFKPRAVANTGQEWRRPHSPAVSSNNASQSTYSMNHYQYQQSYGSGQPTPPQIQNPFPLPGQSNQYASNNGGRNGASKTGFDPEMEAQIAQWQSAYTAGMETTAPTKGGRAVGPESAGGANAVALGSRANVGIPATTANEGVSSARQESGVPSAAQDQDGKQKTVVRSGGGQTWQDPSLLEWDPAHFRLFVGNLAGEVTDDSLLKAFSKYDSVQKARVVRDKRTTKSKGYGFVSFSNGDQYFQAAKEMQGKYIGSHPVLLRRSTTEIKPTTFTDKNKKNAKNNKNSNNNPSTGGSNNGANTGAGVSKKPAKTKGGLKILG